MQKTIETNEGFKILRSTSRFVRNPYNNFLYCIVKNTRNGILRDTDGSSDFYKRLSSIM